MAIPTPPRLPPGERLRRVGVGAWSIIGLLIVLALIVWALFKIKVIFPPLLLAVLIIYMLNPLVSRMQAHGLPRLSGVLISYVVVLGGLTLVVILLTPFVSRQIDNFSEDCETLYVPIIVCPCPQARSSGTVADLSKITSVKQAEQAVDEGLLKKIER